MTIDLIWTINLYTGQKFSIVFISFHYYHYYYYLYITKFSTNITPLNKGFGMFNMVAFEVE